MLSISLRLAVCYALIERCVFPVLFALFHSYMISFHYLRYSYCRIRCCVISVCFVNTISTSISTKSLLSSPMLSRLIWSKVMWSFRNGVFFHWGILVQHWVFISWSGHLKARFTCFDHWWATSLHPLSNLTVILICSDLCLFEGRAWCKR